MSTGSTSGFVEMAFFMSSSTSRERWALALSIRSGEAPPMIGISYSGKFPPSRIFMSTSESIFQVESLTSISKPFRSYRMAGSPPSARRSLGLAASLKRNSRP